ncbi:MAG: hypothetical protein HY201_02880, partial [Nitrospirae bacterium]|nr:hypothetical protein [Candidatus Troglogloeales bacterium]
ISPKNEGKISLIQESFTYQWRHPDPRMDTLQKKVSREVEQMTESNFNAADIFYQLKECAIGMAEGRSIVNLPLDTLPNTSLIRGAGGLSPQGALPPRMTEPWFCCSEPTENQIAVLDCDLK